MNDKDKSTPRDAGPDKPDEGDNGAAAPGVEASPGELLAEAERRAGEFRDQALRAQAELENTRKRAGREIERIRKYAIESFVVDLLDVKDSLERGLGDDVKAGTVEDVREGMRLTLRSLEQTFDRFDVTEVAPAGEVFDPELHQAMSMLETAEQAPNTVVEVVQKGYLLSGRLLRPAMVIVAGARKPDGEAHGKADGEPGEAEDGEPSAAEAEDGAG